MTNHAIDFDLDKLSSYLQSAVADFKPIQSIEKFSVGQSNPTYRFLTADGSYVLRRQPFGKLLKSAHQVDREFRVMASMSAVPVPEMVHLCTDTEVIGAQFFIMSFVRGEQFTLPQLDSVELAVRKDYYWAVVDTLAAIHRVDLSAANLTDYGKGSDFFARQIGLWTKQYELSKTEDRAAMNHLIEWLPTNLPKEDNALTLIHGDYKFDNLLFVPNQPQVAAVLDWELSTLGHPIADVAYLCMCLRMPDLGFVSGLGTLDRAANGIPTEAELVARYCEHTHRDGIDHWSFYLAFSFFRLASISQGVLYRSLQGNASGTQSGHAGKVTQVLAQMGADLT